MGHSACDVVRCWHCRVFNRLAYEVTKAFVQAEKRYFLPVVLFFYDSELRGYSWIRDPGRVMLAKKADLHPIP
jgi:hypothetical protein